jgi:hypothetical protein
MRLFSIEPCLRTTGPSQRIPSPLVSEISTRRIAAACTSARWIPRPAPAAISRTLTSSISTLRVEPETSIPTEPAANVPLRMVTWSAPAATEMMGKAAPRFVRTMPFRSMSTFGAVTVTIGPPPPLIGRVTVYLPSAAMTVPGR